MNIESLQQLANQIGMPDYNDCSSQKMIIRAIQKHRGEVPCFLTDKRYGCREECEWRSSCQQLRAVWLR